MRTLLLPIRIAAALLVAGGTALAVQHLCYLPWRADVERKKQEDITVALWERQPAFTAVRARQNVLVARSFLDKRGIHNTGLYMTAAANYRLLEDYDSASEMYKEALRFDRRPELYYNLGISEVNAGRRKEGVDALIHAGLFNPFLIPDLTDAQIRAEVETAVHKQRFLPWLDFSTKVH